MKTIEEVAKEFEKENGEKIWFSNDHQQGTALCIESFKAGVEFAQRWIPVEEELPKEGSKVLVKLYDNDFIVCMFRNGIFKNTTPTPQKTYGNCDGNLFRENLTEFITHWRYIEIQ